MTETPIRLLVERIARAICKVDEIHDDPDAPMSDWYRANPDNPQVVWQTYIPHAEAAIEILQSNKESVHSTESIEKLL